MAFWDMVIPGWVTQLLIVAGRFASGDYRIFVEDSDSEDEDYLDEEDEDDENLNMKAVFELDVDRTWQARFVVATCGPFLAFFGGTLAISLYEMSVKDPVTRTAGPPIVYTPLHAFGGNVMLGAVWLSPVPKFFVFALACALDLRPLYKVSKEVVCVLPHWVHLVHMNMLPDVNALTLGSEDPKEAELHVPLGSMEELSRFTRGSCYGCALLYVLTCQPFAGR